MADPRQLFSVNDIRPFLELADGSDDALLDVIIKAVTMQVEQFCNRTFESVSYEDTYDGDNEITLYLHHRPVTAISSVVITDSAGIDTTIASSDYTRYEKVGKIVLTEGDAFTKGNLNVAISYTAGETTLPPVVKLAGMKLVRWYYRKWGDNRDGVSSESVGDQTINYEREMPAEIKQMLGPYRQPAFA